MAVVETHLSYGTSRFWSFNRSLCIYWKEFFLFAIISFSLSLGLSISDSSRQHAILACQFFYHIPSSVVNSCLKPPYLYILLNLVIMTIVITSGVLNPTQHSLVLEAASLDGQRLIKSKATFDVKRPNISAYSDPKKLDLDGCDIESSQPKSRLQAVDSDDPLNPLSIDSIEIQETTIFCAYEDKPMSGGLPHVVVEDVQLIQIDEYNVDVSAMQLLQIAESENEMSIEELNLKAEAFIVNFHRQLRQESIRLSMMESRTVAYSL